MQEPLNDPNLTDDTVEAPSFIVPYVYEKPPKATIKDLKKSVQDILDKKEKEEGELLNDDSLSTSDQLLYPLHSIEILMANICEIFKIENKLLFLCLQF